MPDSKYASMVPPRAPRAAKSGLTVRPLPQFVRINGEQFGAGREPRQKNPGLDASPAMAGFGLRILDFATACGFGAASASLKLAKARGQKHLYVLVDQCAARPGLGCIPHKS